MEQLNYPLSEIWQRRQEWFETSMENAQHPLVNYRVSDQATALLVDQ